MENYKNLHIENVSASLKTFFENLETKLNDMLKFLVRVGWGTDENPTQQTALQDISKILKISEILDEFKKEFNGSLDKFDYHWSFFYRNFEKGLDEAINYLLVRGPLAIENLPKELAQNTLVVAIKHEILQ